MVENPLHWHWNTDSASLCHRWTTTNGILNLIVIKGQCRHANVLVCKTNVRDEWKTQRQRAEGGRRGQKENVFSFVWIFYLFSREAYHIAFTLCLLWSSNRAETKSSQEKFELWGNLVAQAQYSNGRTLLTTILNTESLELCSISPEIKMDEPR